MNGNGLMQDLTRFFKAARHLWGRCPFCDSLFRLSEAAISFGSEPPADWLRRLQQQQAKIGNKESELKSWQGELDGREVELKTLEHSLSSRERNLEKTAREMAKGHD